MAGTYIDLVTGVPTQQTAINASAGAGDAGKIARLDAAGRWDVTMMPVGIGPEVATIQASENLSAGDFVNIWNSTGSFRVRKADATAAGKEANGFVNSSVTSGNDATVYFVSNTNTGLTSLTPVKYYLSTTPGAITATPPSGSGNVVQYVGTPSSATTITFVRGEAYVLA